MNLQATIKFFVVSIIQILPKVGVNVFPGHDGRVTPDKKIFANHVKGLEVEIETFSVIRAFFNNFEITSKFPVVFVKLMIDKVGVDGFIGPRQETDIRYEFSLKVTLKGLMYNNRFFQPFLNEFPSRF